MARHRIQPPPSIIRCRSGSSVSGTPGRGPARSSSRRHAARPTAPPVSTGAQGGFAGLVPAAIGVLEQPAVAVIAIALGRRAIGQQHIMRCQLDMVDLTSCARSSHTMERWLTRYSDRDQHAVEVERVTLGDAQVAVRHVVGQRALAHDHRRCRVAPAARRQHVPVPIQVIGLAVAAMRHHPVADDRRSTGTSPLAWRSACPRRSSTLK